jgi:hypothetical protein
MRMGEMTDEELNQYLHENVMGECWHQTGVTDRNFSDGVCVKCPKTDLYGFVGPDYCTSLDAVWGVVHKIFGMPSNNRNSKLMTLLMLEFDPYHSDMMFAEGREVARRVAEACKEAWEQK